MLRTIFASFLTVGLLAGAPAFAADDAYTIKLYTKKVGDQSEHQSTNTSTMTIVSTVKGTENKVEQKSIEKESYSEKILELKEGEKKPIKLTRVYSVAEKTEDNKTTKEIYAGETVLIEKKGDVYEFETKGQLLAVDKNSELFTSFNKKKEGLNEKELLPKVPVKIGVEWKVPAELLEQYFTSEGDSMKVDLKKSSVTGKLIKAYKKDGAQFGIIEMTITAIMAEGSLFHNFGKVKSVSKIVIKGTMDMCIDGTVRFTESKMTSTFDVSTSKPDEVSFQMTGGFTIYDMTKASKK